MTESDIEENQSFDRSMGSPPSNLNQIANQNQNLMSPRGGRGGARGRGNISLSRGYV